MSNRVVHFEIPMDDPRRAVKFYQDTFGWAIQRFGGPQDYWLVTTGEDTERGINGGMLARSDQCGHVTNTIGVENLDAMVERVRKSGGRIVAPKVEIPGVGYLAYAVDTEGNRFGMIQPL